MEIIWSLFKITIPQKFIRFGYKDLLYVTHEVYIEKEFQKISQSFSYVNVLSKRNGLRENILSNYLRSTFFTMSYEILHVPFCFSKFIGSGETYAVSQSTTFNILLKWLIQVRSDKVNIP